MLTTLPTDSNERKEYPLLRGLLRYFPAALAGVARNSKLGNDKHNPGQELHHARGKSPDHGDCIIRHLVDIQDLQAAIERGDTSVTADQVLTEANQLAWRALALSQELHEQFGAPLAPGAKKDSAAAGVQNRELRVGQRIEILVSGAQSTPTQKGDILTIEIVEGHTKSDSIVAMDLNRETWRFTQSRRDLDWRLI